MAERWIYFTFLFIVFCSRFVLLSFRWVFFPQFLLGGFSRCYYKTKSKKKIDDWTSSTSSCIIIVYQYLLLWHYLYYYVDPHIYYVMLQPVNHHHHHYHLVQQLSKKQKWQVSYARFEYKVIYIWLDYIHHEDNIIIYALLIILNNFI